MNAASVALSSLLAVGEDMLIVGGGDAEYLLTRSTHGAMGLSGTEVAMRS